MTTKVTDGMTSGLVKTSSLASKTPSSKSSGDEGKVVQLNAAGVIPTVYGGGRVLQVAQAVVTAAVSGTGVIPADDTIPQNTEGTEGMTLAFTPTAATSTLYIDIRASVRNNHSGSNQLCAALFVDSTANALAAVGQLTAADEGGVFSINHSVSAASTSARTYKVRFGGNNSATTTLNCVQGATTRIYGGVASSTITITEIGA